jgi:hypothetical protein
MIHIKGNRNNMINAIGQHITSSKNQSATAINVLMADKFYTALTNQSPDFKQPILACFDGFQSPNTIRLFTLIQIGVRF